MKRSYHVIAIPIRIVVNNFGEHDPDGQIYVLKENEAKVKELVLNNPFTPVDLVEPLTIRANEGDTVEVLFENRLPNLAGMHFQEADYDVLTADGANVGFNPSTLVKYGEKIIYRIHATRQGIYFFSDLGTPASSEKGSQLHGLFGALFVETRGSWWTDPVTGEPLKSGTIADVHNPFLPSFREYGWFFSDQMEIDDLTGNRPIDPVTNQDAESFHGVNLRFEPLRNRKKLLDEGVVCPECDGEEVHHDSWVFGDPATPIYRGYRGDPVRFRVIHAGVKETHVFHYHTHQWFRDPGNAESNLIDSQAISPQSHYDIIPLYGLGSLQGAIGDVIVHCHLYPHFEGGMWALNRIFDTLQDGSQTYPNGIPIKTLQPLPDRPAPPKPTKERPGFPNFIPGKVGCKAPRPPLGIIGGRDMTELERNASIPNARPGAVFTEVCLGNPVVIEFNISVIELPIIYNNQGWNDPKGRIFVLDEDIADILSGKLEPEPLTLHIPANSCIRVNFTNRLPHVLDGDAFQLVTRTYECALHVHFVKIDPLVSDGANVGWNYDSSVLPDETIRYEWFADTELKAFFLHDHMFPTVHEDHGVFGTGVAQPRFSRIFDSVTGEEVDHGTQVTVVNPLIPDYRDFALFVQDFVFLFVKNGCPLAPPPYPGSLDDPGLFAVNFKNEPLQFRLGEDSDPAYSFSSFVNGDPVTPILLAYEGDPIRIRLLQGSHEESHSFNLHGLRWKNERKGLDGGFKSQQHIGISESFTFDTFLPREGDYLWAFETEEDIWNGTWGLIRAFGQEVPHLMPLLDRPLPPKRTELLPEWTGAPPDKAPKVMNTAPPDAPVRRYSVVAFQTSIVYSSHGEHDPYGIVFALEEDVGAIKVGEKNPEPLVLRGNVGDLVEVSLRSELQFDRFPYLDGIHPYPPVKEQAPYPPSVRISLHPSLLDYDVKTSSGETVGYNYDQTVGPGELVTYRWYVDTKVGACSMWDMADLRNHRSFGAFGCFVAEAKGTEYLDPCTRQKVRTGANVILSNSLLPEIREFVLIMHDGVRLVDKKDHLIVDPIDGILGEQEELQDLVDTYDNGSRGFNYRTERLINRFIELPDTGELFSSKVHGDPSTPLFEAYAGDPVVIRLVNPSERRRAHTFHLHGHYWKYDDLDFDSRIVSFVGEIVAGHTNNLYLIGGAGGLFSFPGDYMYRSGNIRWDIEQGMWGIMRVHDCLQSHLVKLK
ncbi:multicopper oxidase domain-containing protein [Bacillus sp. V59.32b]|uniref:multicopper oxidase domain-containing protein n=1 Tax=Bacillus sp. V59.32b TaxID=1758642 RepID=UPI000E3E732E|nr:multicopper oxidase domain-containing protein [Bacillus sp. V59.32b]RFU64609.1 copper oxidase [Bacillus sp. V59.32b]